MPALTWAQGRASIRRVKYTFQPHRKRRLRAHGFRARMRAHGGRLVLSARRRKGRRRLTVSDERGR